MPTTQHPRRDLDLDQVWGSSPAYDTTRNAIYVTTGNNNSMPPRVITCVQNAPNDAAAHARIHPADHFDSVLSLDAGTGAIKWAPSPAQRATTNSSPSVCPDPGTPRLIRL
jgi:hypothetical protein